MAQPCAPWPPHKVRCTICKGGLPAADRPSEAVFLGTECKLTDGSAACCPMTLPRSGQVGPAVAVPTQGRTIRHFGRVGSHSGIRGREKVWWHCTFATSAFEQSRGAALWAA